MNRKIFLTIVTISCIGFGMLLVSCEKENPRDIDDPDENGNTVEDIDGNKYPVVEIGTQVWMAENLKVTKLNDGTPIPEVSDDIAWDGYDEINDVVLGHNPAYCWSLNDRSFAESTKYNILYNFQTVETGMLCPSGWHVPTDEDWTILEEYIGQEGEEGQALKATEGWNVYDSEEHPQEHSNGLDLYGFKALPSGYRGFNGQFFRATDQGGGWGLLWTSNTAGPGYAICRILADGSSFIGHNEQYRDMGMAVRCVKDGDTNAPSPESFSIFPSFPGCTNSTGEK